MAPSDPRSRRGLGSRFVQASVDATGLVAALLLLGCDRTPSAPRSGGGELPAGWPDAAALWQGWEQERIVETAASCLRHAELVDRLEALHRDFPESSRLEPVGRSFEGRSIQMLSLGRGATEVLLWSQMHGDEPSATPALLDVAHYLLAHAEEPMPAAILESLTLRMVPMLNPDGSERYERRNTQGIDINRDALNLATPEGRLLKELRDRYEPLLGFNLHDQNRRTAVGDTRGLATAAVLAVAGDEVNTVTPGRERAMRASAAIVEALEPYLPGGIARYDEDWSPRAFGDNLTAWGSPVVLIESGGVPLGVDSSVLVRLNFVALLRVLAGLVHDDLESYDEAVYRDLPRNRSNVWVDVLVQGGRVLQGTGVPYRSDLAFNVHRSERFVDSDGVCRFDGEPTGSSITELGDGRFLGAARVVDADSHLVVPAFHLAIVGWERARELDASLLARLAGWGVAALHWQVPRERYLDAVDLAESLSVPGRTALVVHTEELELPRADLDRLTEEAPPERFAERVAGLVGRADPSPLERARQLLPGGSSSGPVLRPGAAASFLLVDDAGEPGEVPALLDATVHSVWLDGVEVGASAERR